MAKRAKEIDVKLLLYAIQRTASLEQLLAVRFTGHTLLEESGQPIKNKVCMLFFNFVENCIIIMSYIMH
jgi:hypothetical protein